MTEKNPANQGVREKGTIKEMKIELHKDKKFTFVEIFSEENTCWSNSLFFFFSLFVIVSYELQTRHVLGSLLCIY